MPLGELSWGLFLAEIVQSFQGAKEEFYTEESGSNSGIKKRVQTACCDLHPNSFVEYSGLEPLTSTLPVLRSTR
ncbi:hypothetical protein PORCRE_155 [Porphyromonas crevioricanis JCM 15906]|uniref:Uncharacterized protein n=1 Tax=Porphyromonas crevioricanis JCM 15906 TaxID=1305617 RepID=S4N977_9PORP|nr:hypothetical protein PORCRE_155 [Porphyromonas crevioricanis JCM 15906]GAD07057.1 hypothetical protein PORCAN_670 [Porphyromonas crevioricanis JCM 13913]